MPVFTGKPALEGSADDEDFADLIKSRVNLDWNELKKELPEMPTEALIALMKDLGLYVNKTLALEIAGRGDAVFWLRKLIQDGRYWETDNEDYGKGWLPLHAIHILATIKTSAALGLLLDTLRYRGDDLSDFLTEDAPTLLAAFGEGAVESLKKFTEDETLEAFVRGAATEALWVLARKFPFREEEIKSHLVKLLSTTADPTFAALVADNLASFHDPSLMPEIHRAFEEHRIDGDFMSEDEFEEIIKGEHATTDDNFKRHTRDPLNYFSRENIEHLYDIGSEYERRAERLENKPEKKKIGRNAPCPCGSGKKYKKCCWPKTFGVG